MFFDFRRTGFLRPRDRLYELLALQHFAEGDDAAGDATTDGTFDRRTLKGYAEALRAGGFIAEDAAGRLAVTEAGKSRARYLLVDYMRELKRLREGARDILRRSLAPLALAGVKRVAFYPMSETAEVAVEVLNSLGLELVAVIDDAPEKQGSRFRDLRIEPLDALRSSGAEAVIVTTAVFREKVTARLNALQITGLRVHEL